MPYKQEITDATPGMIALRRDVHANPEIEFQESRTASIIAERLATAGLEVEQGIGHTGVVGVLAGGSEGPTLMIRADIDALPMAEDTGLPFASTVDAMHACGHDSHIAIAVTAAELLARHRGELNGTVIFAFHPAEENNVGAQAMADDGFFDRYKADRVIALHISAGDPTGVVSAAAGPTMAGKDTFRLTITGSGGHGAMPHLSVDPVVIASHVVTALQTLVSRETPPNEMAVVTIGEIHSGTAGNIIPATATMSGAIRWFSEETQKTLLDGLVRTAQGVARAMRGDSEYEWLSGTPPCVNDERVTAWMQGVAAGVVGASRVEAMTPQTASDDMSLFLSAMPGSYFSLGAAIEGKPEAQAHHSPSFDIDEAAFPVGVELFMAAAFDYLKA